MGEGEEKASGKRVEEAPDASAATKREKKKKSQKGKLSVDGQEFDLQGIPVNMKSPEDVSQMHLAEGAQSTQDEDKTDDKPEADHEEKKEDEEVEQPTNDEQKEEVDQEVNQNPIQTPKEDEEEKSSEDHHPHDNHQGPKKNEQEQKQEQKQEPRNPQTKNETDSHSKSPQPHKDGKSGKHHRRLSSKKHSSKKRSSEHKSSNDSSSSSPTSPPHVDVSAPSPYCPPLPALPVASPIIPRVDVIGPDGTLLSAPHLLDNTVSSQFAPSPRVSRMEVASPAANVAALPGSVAFFSCPQGFLLIGAPTLTCQPALSLTTSPVWSPLVSPRCVRTCQLPPSITFKLKDISQQSGSTALAMKLLRTPTFDEETHQDVNPPLEDLLESSILLEGDSILFSCAPVPHPEDALQTISLSLAGASPVSTCLPDGTLSGGSQSVPICTPTCVLPPVSPYLQPFKVVSRRTTLPPPFSKSVDPPYDTSPLKKEEVKSSFPLVSARDTVSLSQPQSTVTAATRKLYPGDVVSFVCVQHAALSPVSPPRALRLMGPATTRCNAYGDFDVTPPSCLVECSPFEIPLEGGMIVKRVPTQHEEKFNINNSDHDDDMKLEEMIIMGNITSLEDIDALPPSNRWVGGLKGLKILGLKRQIAALEGDEMLMQCTEYGFAVSSAVPAGLNGKKALESLPTATLRCGRGGVWEGQRPFCKRMVTLKDVEVSLEAQKMRPAVPVTPARSTEDEKQRVETVKGNSTDASSEEVMPPLPHSATDQQKVDEAQKELIEQKLNEVKNLQSASVEKGKKKKKAGTKKSAEKKASSASSSSSSQTEKKVSKKNKQVSSSAESLKSAAKGKKVEKKNTKKSENSSDQGEKVTSEKSNKK
eukprot:GDKK01006988.1.p1 GENE.GDKK01006988.1~~GDKK01006988.1.p1  ORF type:complete len:871 (-),score=320.33 GDKK01006988.1:97-2709(-)